MKQKSMKTLQQGFTILELIVVVAIVGLLTSLATDYMVNEGNQGRYKATQERIHQVHYALVGDSSRTINNQPAFSGYLADTGYKPKYIRDLLSNGYCTNVKALEKSSCDAAQAEWREVANWKGPYLQATSYQDVMISDETLVTIPVFRDGWGNRSPESDHLNFGWDFQPNFENRAMRLSSYGLNGVGRDDDPQSSDYLFEKDQFTLIGDAQLMGAPLKVALEKGAAVKSAMYCLKAEYTDGSEQRVDLATQNEIPAASVFGKVHVTGLKKNAKGDSCEQAVQYSGIGPYDFYSHNGFSASSTVQIAIN